MLENAFGLLAGTLFLMLRIAPGGSFPRPLGREEEQDCLQRRADGDLEARIVRLRYGLNGREPLTQRETATALGISRSYVSRIEKKALEKLRRALE